MSTNISLPVPSVSLVNDQPATTSLAIAEHFKKQHAHVMRDIRKLCADLPEDVRQSNFGLTFRTVAGPNNSERQEEFYTVFFDGFILLAMGYTGKTALKIKLAYIQAFNAMRVELEQKAVQPSPTSVIPTANDPITPDQQCTIQTVIKARVEAIPPAERPKGIWPMIWSRFNNHFRLGSYKQLPQCRLSEAIEYLMNMDVMPKKELPASNTPVGLEAIFQLGYMPYDPSPISHTYSEDRELDSIFRTIRGCEGQLECMVKGNQMPPVPKGQELAAVKLRETFLASCYVARRALGAMFEMGRQARREQNVKAIAGA